MAIYESLILNGLSLATGNFVLEAVDFTPPAKKPEWAQAADGDGADLIRTPLFENRTITAKIGVNPQGSMNAAIERVGEIVDQLQEAEKNPGGTALEWTPANSTKTISFAVLTGAVTGIPVVVEGNDAGYLAAAPKLTVSLTCKPFGYGAEVEAAAAKSIETGLSVVTLTVPNVAGDVPAEGRLVVKDTSGVGRRNVEWGLQNRYYDAATKLILDSEDMVPASGAQNAAITAPPAYKRVGATNTVIFGTLLPEPTLFCTTGNLGHVGTFRVKARILANATAGGSELSEVHVRMSWQDGEGPFRANDWQTPVGNELFSEIDLGLITVTPAVGGTQKWSGRIEAYAAATPLSTSLCVDYLVFVPVAEGYGKARGVQSSVPGTVSAYDNFTTGSLSGNLGARTAPLGGAWTTSGATTDWTVEATRIKRATISDASPRYGVFGPALTAVRTVAQGTLFVGGKPYIGVIARWVNETNYAAVRCERAEGIRMILEVKVAGVSTVLAEVTKPLYGGNAFEMHAELTALPDGSLAAVIGGTFSVTLTGSHASIATGGALASGKCGITDKATNAEASSRAFTVVGGYILPGTPYCIQPSRAMEVRSDSTITADSTGTYYGPVPQYRGSRFYVPQAGSAKRTSRILVKADRNDLQEADQQTMGDAFTAAVFATPRYHLIPR